MSPKNFKLIKEMKYFSAVKIILILAGSIFISECLIMLVLPLFPEMGVWETMIVDSTSLVILVSPILYFSVFSPLKKSLDVENYSKELAEKVTESKSKFLIRMNHEMRTPLGGILSNLELFELEKEDLEKEKIIGDIRTSAQRLNRIIANVLDYSNINKGSIKVSLQTFNLESLITNCIWVVRKDAIDKGNKVSFNMDTRHSSLYKSDEKILGQIIFNFLSNANKYTDGGEVSLNVEFLEESNDEALIEFTVTDNGCGISKEGLDRIFKPFERIITLKGKVLEGAGLGLTITAELIEKLGGKVKVSSEEGKGSSFSFKIKLLKAEVEAEAKAETKAEVETEKRLSDEVPLKILLVDDEIINQKIGTRFLKSLGYQVSIANDGLEALKLVSEQSFDLILMDILMPNMNGVEATKSIFKIKDHERPIIIPLTGNATEDQKKECIEVGMVDFISKPYKKSDLTRVIKKYFDVKKVA